jgi:hypothetical protein
VSLLAPWALVGLLALPAIWWAHRRARRPLEVDVPSLLFLAGEEPEGAHRRRRLDAELLLALAAAGLLAFAAAGPRAVAGPAGRTVRVVVARGAFSRAAGYEDRVERSLAAIRGALGRGDALDVVSEDAGPSGRPSADALLASARAGRSALAVVVSDRLPSPLPRDVRGVGIGDPGAANVGFVAASVQPSGDGVSVFVAVRNDAAGPAEAPLRRDAGTFDVLPLAAGGHATKTFVLAGRPERIEVSNERPGALATDDRLVLTRAPLAVRLDPSLPPAHAAAVRAALAAVLGKDGFREGAASPDLAFGTASGTSSAALRVVLFPAADGATTARAPEGAETVSSSPWAKDLSTAGVDLVYAEPRPRPPEDLRVLLARGADAVVGLRKGEVWFLPDPLRGRPSPARTPLWPLFVENVVTGVAGRPLALGYRVDGLADPDATLLGRDVAPFDPAWLRGLAPDREPAAVALRPWLVGGAVLCRLLLTLAPRMRGEGRRRVPVPLAPVP